MKLLFSIFINLLKISWKIIKFLSKPMWESIKGLWKASWNFYKERKAQKAASAGNAEDASRVGSVVGSDESVQFNAHDLKDKYANCSSDDLQRMYDLMTDNAVKVDANPELEEFLKTYGRDQEIFKQEIMDELKRRRMESKKQSRQDIEDDKG